jgi:HEPN domain-containing protein
MSGADEETKREEVEAWLRLAENDRRTAEICIVAEPPLVGIAAFHCQQAAEKLLKGFLVQAGVVFGKTHDLKRLSETVASAFPDLRDLVDATREWSVWSVAYRYPAGESLAEPEPAATELQRAFAVIDDLTLHLRSLAGRQRRHG